MIFHSDENFVSEICFLPSKTVSKIIFTCVTKATKLYRAQHIFTSSAREDGLRRHKTRATFMNLAAEP